MVSNDYTLPKSLHPSQKFTKAPPELYSYKIPHEVPLHSVLRLRRPHTIYHITFDPRAQVLVQSLRPGACARNSASLDTSNQANFYGKLPPSPTVGRRSFAKKKPAGRPIMRDIRRRNKLGAIPA